MTKLNDYILTEGRGKSMKEDDALNWIFQNCQKLIKWMGTGERGTGRFISRSVSGKSDDNYWFVDPKKAPEPRKSANTKNYYTLIMDNESMWSKYPKRSQSLICLTDGYDYGRDEWIMFFKDGWRIGNTNERDFWGVSDKIDTRLENMSDWAEMVYILLNFDKKSEGSFINYDKTLPQFKKRCQEFDEWISEQNMSSETAIQSILYGTQFKYQGMYKLFTETYRGNLYNLLKSHITPSRLGITLNKVGDNLPKKTEVWTDSPCIMVNSHRWHSPALKIKERILGQ